MSMKRFTMAALLVLLTLGLAVTTASAYEEYTDADGHCYLFTPNGDGTAELVQCQPKNADGMNEEVRLPETVVDTAGNRFAVSSISSITAAVKRFIRFLLPSSLCPRSALYSANIGVERYRSPVSGSSTTTVLPAFSGRRATRMAALRAAPEEMPTR